MAPSRMEEIAARCLAATPGPWIDMAEVFRARMLDYHKRTRKWWHGTRAWSTPVVLIARARDREGEPIAPEDIPERVDWHDLVKVIGWRWGLLPRRTTSIAEGFLRPEDAAFIAHAREDVPELLDEVARLGSENHELWWLLANIGPHVREQELSVEYLSRLLQATRARADLPEAVKERIAGIAQVVTPERYTIINRPGSTEFRFEGE